MALFLRTLQNTSRSNIFQITLNFFECVPIVWEDQIFPRPAPGQPLVHRTIRPVTNQVTHALGALRACWTSETTHWKYLISYKITLCIRALWPSLSPQRESVKSRLFFFSRERLFVINFFSTLLRWIRGWRTRKIFAGGKLRHGMHAWKVLLISSALYIYVMVQKGGGDVVVWLKLD